MATMLETFTLGELARILGAEVDDAHAEVRCRGASSDTRTIASGQLFAALGGPRFDAHDFLETARDAGAAAALVSDVSRVPAGMPALVVPDVLLGLKSLGAAVWARATERGARTIALTGSNGKTTTKELLRVMWQTYGPTHATRGNYNNHIGVPLTLANTPAEVDTLVVEMGANQPGDIGELIVLAPGDIRIVTSIGHAHIEGFGGLDGVRGTKREIFNGATEDTLAIVPVTERDNLLDPDFPGRVVTFGPEDGPDADVTFAMSSPETPGEGVRVEVHLEGGETWSIVSPLHGSHNASNLAAACATQWFTDGVHAGAELVSAALGHLDLPDGRWRVVEVGEALIVDDAYNANPSSVMASLEGFDQWQRASSHVGKRVVVLGQMLELGERAKYWHEEISRCMSRISDLDVFIAVGPYAEAMVSAARDELQGQGRSVELHGVEGPGSAADVIAGLGQTVVFLKGSRGARLERIIDAVQDGLDETARGED